MELTRRLRLLRVQPLSNAPSLLMPIHVLRCAQNKAGRIFYWFLMGRAICSNSKHIMTWAYPRLIKPGFWPLWTDHWTTLPNWNSFISRNHWTMSCVELWQGKAQTFSSMKITQTDTPLSMTTSQPAGSLLLPGVHTLCEIFSRIYKPRKVLNMTLLILSCDNDYV